MSVESISNDIIKLVTLHGKTRSAITDDLYNCSSIASSGTFF